MAYKTPAKFKDRNGATIPTKTLRIAEYLYDEIEAIALKRHAEKLAKGEAPVIERSA